MTPTPLVLSATLIALALPLAMPAQEKKDAAEMSVTGCFNKGDAEGYYVITDEKTGNKITVIGDAGMLASHAKPHKVTITGSMTKENDKDVLKASKLQMWWTSLVWPCPSSIRTRVFWAALVAAVLVVLGLLVRLLRSKGTPPSPNQT
jgi:hypothetical protein